MPTSRWGRIFCGVSPRRFWIPRTLAGRFSTRSGFLSCRIRTPTAHFGTAPGARSGTNRRRRIRRGIGARRSPRRICVMRCGSRPDATWNSGFRICAQRTAWRRHGFASTAPLRCTGACTGWVSAAARCSSSKSIGGIAQPGCRRVSGRPRTPSACRCTTATDRARKAFSILPRVSGRRRKPPPCAHFSRPGGIWRPPRCSTAAPWNMCAAWAATPCAT